MALHKGTVPHAPGGLGGECVDLANLWLLEAFGLPHVYANAVDWAWEPVRGWAFTRNTPLNVPPVGALVVWGPYKPLGIGVNGHIAVCLLADVNHMLTFDANFSAREAALYCHEYGGVAGWLAPVTTLP